jgi:hypothetical protein
VIRLDGIAPWHHHTALSIRFRHSQHNIPAAAPPSAFVIDRLFPSLPTRSHPPGTTVSTDGNCKRNIVGITLDVTDAKGQKTKIIA